ncbi:MAG: alpha/beta hydrolase family protein, partial [Rhodothalassiaceae bacterium]
MVKYFFSMVVLLATTAVAAWADSRSARDLPVAAFAALPQLADIDISPDGTHLAYMLAVEGRQMIVVHPLGSAEDPVIIPPFSEADISWFRWANEEILAVSFAHSTDRMWVNGYRLRGGRNTEQTIFLGFKRDGSNLQDPIRLAKGERHRSTSTRMAREGSAPIVQDWVIDWLVDDPNHLLLATDGDFDGKIEVRKVRVRDGVFDVIMTGTDGITFWRTDQSGEIRFGYGEDGDVARGIYRGADGAFRPVDHEEWFQRGIRPVVFEEDPRFAFAVGKVRADSDVQGVVRLDMETGEILEIVYEHPDFDAAGVMVDPDDRRFIGVVTPAERNGRRYMAQDWMRLQTSIDKAFPKTSNRIVSWSPDRRLIVLETSSDVESGSVYVWDRNKKTVGLLGARHQHLTPELMSPMRRISFPARDGLDISGYLTTPKGVAEKDLPLVIMPHGGPFALETWGFDFMTQMMASRGFAVLQPNFRGSILQGEAFHEAGKKQWGGKMQDDLTDGVRYLVDQGIVDPERVCIVGWSYGGYAALMGTVKTPDLYQCAVSINGVSSLPKLAARYSFSPDYRRFIREYVGLEGERLSKVSPVHQAEAIKAPGTIGLPHSHTSPMLRTWQERTLHCASSTRCFRTKPPLGRGSSGRAG